MLNTSESHPQVSSEGGVNENGIKEPAETPDPPNIKEVQHIVISGGNIYGFSYYGVLKRLHQKGIWELSSIKTMYATSIGSILATILCLDYEWEIIDNFMINRPLKQLINFEVSTLLGCVQNCGFFTLKLIEEYFYNLFTGKDLSPRITMLEFYQVTGVELHFFTTKVFGFQLTDLSYKTHPHWTMVEAMYASSAIFPFLGPIFKDEELYVDGGFLLNNPIDMCISGIRSLDPDVSNNILSIRLKKYVIPNKTKYLMVDNYNIFSFFQELIENILSKVSLDNITNDTNNSKYIRYLFELEQDTTSTMDFTIYSNIEARKKFIDQGVEIVEKWVKHDMPSYFFG